MRYRQLPVTFIALLASSFIYAVPDDFLDKLESEARPVEDKPRDGSRRPLQVLELLGTDEGEGMTVIDVASGEGWFTEMLTGPGHHGSHRQ